MRKQKEAIDYCTNMMMQINSDYVCRITQKQCVARIVGDSVIIINGYYDFKQCPAWNSSETLRKALRNERLKLQITALEKQIEE